MTLYPKLILDALATVRYPGTGKNLVEAEMVADNLRIDGMSVSFSLIFEKPTDPFMKSMIKAAETAIHTYVSPDVQVAIATESRQAARPEPGKLLPLVKNVIAVSSGKGGVGKTSLALNFGIRLKLAGAKVLFVDMDPQCNLTYIMGIDEAPVTVYDLLTGQSDVREAILHTGEADLIAASPALSTLNLSLNGPGREYLLRNALQPIVGEYNFIVIDSPPTLGILTINILTAADSVIIPALADVFSLQGVGQLYMTIQTVQANSNPKLRIAGIVLSRHTDRLLLNREMKEMLRNTAEQMHTKVFESVIRESVIVRESQAMRQSIFKYSARSRQTEDYDRFALEYLQGAGYLNN